MNNIIKNHRRHSAIPPGGRGNGPRGPGAPPDSGILENLENQLKSQFSTDPELQWVSIRRSPRRQMAGKSLSLARFT